MEAGKDQWAAWRAMSQAWSFILLTARARWPGRTRAAASQSQKRIAQPTIIAIRNEITYKFLLDVIGEIVELTPGLHLLSGGNLDDPRDEEAIGAAACLLDEARSNAAQCEVAGALD